VWSFKTGAQGPQLGLSLSGLEVLNDLQNVRCHISQAQVGKRPARAPEDSFVEEPHTHTPSHQRRAQTPDIQ
jgi:hypothetical protein